MDTDHDTPRSPETPARMPAIAQELFGLVGQSDIQASASAIQIAEELIKSPPADLPVQERPLLAYALLANFRQDLTAEQSAALKDLREEAERDPMSITAQTVKRAKVLRQSASNFFRAQSRPSDFVEVSKVESPVAMGVLLLEAHGISSQMNRGFKQKQQPNNLAAAYVNPHSGEVGVWMSTAGVPFSPSGLKK